MSAFFGYGMVHSLAWTLLHFCWQGAVVGLLLWCCLRLMEGVGSRVRYGVCCVALALVAGLPLATFGFLAAQEREVVRSRDGVVEVPGMVVRVGADARVGWVERVDEAAPWVLRIWLVGAVVFLGRLQVGLMVARRMQWMATSAAPLELALCFARMRERMGVSRPVRLLHSALVRVPTVVGWMRPVVLVPVSCFTGMTEAQIEAVLCHELAHVLRHDYLVSVAQSVVEAVLFYHPAVWWISKQVRRERECCCDELAVGMGGDALGYARALAQLEARRSFYPDVALAANGGVLTMRIKRMLGVKEGSAASQMVAMAVLMAMVGVAAAALAETKAASAGQQAVAPTAEDKTLLDKKVAMDRAMQGVTVKDDAGLSVIERKKMLEKSMLRASLEAPAPVAEVTEQGAPLKIGSGEMAGQLESKVDPVYPAIAKAARVEGSVVLRAIISKTGRVMNLQVLSGATMLRASAMDAVKQWVYKPYLLNGEPTDVDTTVTVNFSFGEGSGSGQGAGVGTSSSSNGTTSSSSAWGPQAPATGAGYIPEPKQVSAGMMAGQLLTKVDPVYPAEAKEKRIQGAVMLWAVISKEGKITNLQLMNEPTALTGSAIDAVRQWVYKPYLLNGQPTEVETTITVNFSLGATPPGMSSVMEPKKVGNGVSAPKPVHMEDPTYTEAARLAKVSGNVLVNLWVDEKGNPTHVTVVRGLGNGLDEKAVESVRKYKFTPAMENGKPVTVAMNIEVNFQIF